MVLKINGWEFFGEREAIIKVLYGGDLLKGVELEPEKGGKGRKRGEKHQCEQGLRPVLNVTRRSL